MAYIATLSRIRTDATERAISCGFTLIELLVVIVVLSLLAAFVAPNVFQHVGTAKDAAARSQIEMLGAALDAYRLDNGRYPTTEQELEALLREPVLDPRPRTGGVRTSARQCRSIPGRTRMSIGARGK